MTPDEQRLPATGFFFSWGAVIAGATSAAALSSVLITFGVAIGLSVASASPTWRDASAALALLSGLFLVLQALAAFGLGGYLAGRARTIVAAPPATVERTDGAHGLVAWALAIIISLTLTGIVAGSGSAARPRSLNTTASAAEPLLSYELDRLFRSPRRPPSVDLSAERAEAGRILLTAAGHSGVTTEDRAFLVQQVAGVTGLAASDAERRVDDAIGKSQAAVRKSRQTAVILAFSAAAALLLGSVMSWAAAVEGGRHRDGEPLPRWMSHGDYLTRRRSAAVKSATPASPRPLPE